MKYAFAFVVFGAVSLLGASVAGSTIGMALLANLGVAFVGAGLGYAGVGPRVFLKRRDGRLSTLSYVLFWPYFVVNHVLLSAYRLFTGENAFDEIAPGVVLGARLYPRDESALLQEPLGGVLDLTCEFSEVEFLRRTEHYLCIPLLDTTAPPAEQLERGVVWIRDRVAQGRVYVHCAMGHGRSATFVAALLVCEGLVPNPRRGRAQDRVDASAGRTERGSAPRVGGVRRAADRL